MNYHSINSKLFAIILLEVIISSIILTSQSVTTIQNMANENIFHYEQQVMAAKKEALKNYVDMAKGVLQTYRDKVTPDTTPSELEQIKKDAIKAMDSMLYGDDTGYVFVWSYDGVPLAFNPRPDLIGKKLLDLKGGNGQWVIKDHINNAKKGGGHFYTYKWRTTKDSPYQTKISYSFGLQDWRWFVGTGNYMAREEKEIAQRKEVIIKNTNQLKQIIIITASILILITSTILFFLIRKILILPLKQLEHGMIDFFLFLQNKRNKIEPIIINSNDEIGKMAKGINDNIQVSIKLHKELAESVQQATVLNETLERKVQARTEDLESQYQYLQSVIDAIEDPVMVIAEDYTVTLMNAAVSKQLDERFILDSEHPKCYEISHQRSTPCDDRQHPCPHKEVFKTNQHMTVIHDHANLDGEQHYVELAATPLFDSEQRCIGLIESARDITAHLEVQDNLRDQKSILDHQAHHDPLTGLPNRLLFNDRLEQSIEKAKRNETKVALLFVDLDHFKEINDSLGHDIGDEILIAVTKRLDELIRKEDTFARLGGDEFTVILEDLINGQDASRLAQKILEVLALPFTIKEHLLYISSSIGISLYPTDGYITHDLLKYADAAMYKAKDKGRNNFQYYSAEMTELAFERVEMETNLRTALQKGEFVVYYQPQINGKTNKLVGMEALVRWQNPKMGLVSPAKFIPLAESTGLIVELDQFVMKTAMKQVALWYKQGLNPGRLALNLAIKQLQQGNFINILKNIIKETECKVEWLELEVTEGQIMTNPDCAIKMLNQISALGISLAIDDFGTGYSSLSYIKKLPINKLKIDQSFIQDLPSDDEDVAIVRAVVAMAKSLNLSLIAEGVETKAQKDFLVNNECKDIQGYYYSKPISSNEMETYLLTKK